MRGYPGWLWLSTVVALLGSVQFGGWQALTHRTSAV